MVMTFGAPGAQRFIGVPFWSSSCVHHVPSIAGGSEPAALAGVTMAATAIIAIASKLSALVMARRTSNSCWAGGGSQKSGRVSVLIVVIVLGVLIVLWPTLN